MKIKSGQFKANKHLAKIGAILLALLLSLSVTACVLSPSATQGDNQTAPDTPAMKPENDRFFREDEWIRLLSLAVSNPDGRLSLWESVPAVQRAEITLSDFIQYIDFLSTTLPGTITSFARATEEESETLRTHVIKNDKTLVPTAQQATFWWLHAETSDGRELRFAVPVTLNNQRVPYFSRSWLQKQQALYHYIVLYLEAVKLRNETALTSLIWQNTLIKSQSHEESMSKRASALIASYFQHTTPGIGACRIIEMVPGYALVEQQGPPGNNPMQQERTVSFVENDGIITANEKFPELLSSDDSLFLFGDNRIFRLDQDVSVVESGKMLSMLGTPLDIKVLNDSDPQAVHYQVIWPGLTVEAIGTCNIPNLEFTGRLRQASATYTTYRTGSGLKPGDSIYELYKRYPFVRENGYMISRGEIVRKTLSIQVETDIITRLTITLEP